MSLTSHIMRRNGKWAPINNRARRERLFCTYAYDRLPIQTVHVEDYFYFLEQAAAYRRRGQFPMARYYIGLARTQPNMRMIPG